jgi:hypothetical protein
LENLTYTRKDALLTLLFAAFCWSIVQKKYWWTALSAAVAIDVRILIAPVLVLIALIAYVIGIGAPQDARRSGGHFAKSLVAGIAFLLIAVGVIWLTVDNRVIPIMHETTEELRGDGLGGAGASALLLGSVPGQIAYTLFFPFPSVSMSGWGTLLDVYRNLSILAFYLTWPFAIVGLYRALRQGERRKVWIVAIYSVLFVQLLLNTFIGVYMDQLGIIEPRYKIPLMFIQALLVTFAFTEPSKVGAPIHPGAGATNSRA